jgi:hypothetical protein
MEDLHRAMRRAPGRDPARDVAGLTPLDDAVPGMVGSARVREYAFFRELLPRLEHIELVGGPGYTASTFVGGPKRMPVRYRLRAAR